MASNAKKRGPTGGLSIFDKPDVDRISDTKEFKAEDFREIRSSFDAFVVEGMRVYYHVHWERVGYYDPKTDTWDIKYQNISGKVVPDGKLPPGFLNEKGQLFLGYNPAPNATNKFVNPVYKPFPQT